MARLEIREGPNAGQSFPFRDEVLIGRSTYNAVPLVDGSVSRQHAHITRKGITYFIEDLNSTNGTVLRKTQIPSKVPHPLLDGDEICIGTSKLIFHIEENKEYAYNPGQGFFNIVTAHPRLFLVLALLIAACFISFAPLAKTVNNVDYFKLEDDPATEFYESFKELFGNDEFFIVAFEKEDIFTRKYLTLLREITEAFEKLEDVREVKSLTNVDQTIGQDNNFEVKKLVEEIPETPQELQILKSKATTNPLYVKNFISPNARTAAIVVFPKALPGDDNYRQRLLEKTKHILEPYRKAGHEFFLAGWTVTNLYLSQSMKTDLTIFIPATYVCIAIVIWIVFNNTWITGLALINISVCMASVMGLFGLTGITINNITTIAIPLIMALALSDTVHIFSHMDRQVLDEFPDKYQALASILHQVVLPCFLTSVTTAIGFASLAVSQIISIKEFALIASAGMLFEFFYGFILMPSLILLIPPEKVYQDYSTPTQGGLTAFLRGLASWVERHHKLILLTTALMVGICGWLALSIKVETNLLEYFKQDSEVRKDVAFVEQRLGGVGSFDISLQAIEFEAFQQPQNLQVIDSLQMYVQSLQGVDVTLSLVDFLKDMNRAFHDDDQQAYRIPETKELVAQYLLLYSSEDIEDVINSTYDHARISVRIAEHSTTVQAQLLKNIQDYIAQLPHPGIEIRLTGRAVQDVKVIDTLVASQTDSLGVGAVVIGLVMCLMLRSFLAGFLSLFPNLVPIVANFGIMSLVGIPLNNATAMIASVALGMAVDNNIHFLSEYRKKRVEGTSIPQALEEIIVDKGRAVTSSSLILSIGFGVLMLASFVPTIQFGLLSAIIMVINVVDDLLFLPALIFIGTWKGFARNHTT